MDDWIGESIWPLLTLGITLAVTVWVNRALDVNAKGAWDKLEFIALALGSIGVLLTVLFVERQIAALRAEYSAPPRGVVKAVETNLESVRDQRCQSSPRPDWMAPEEYTDREAQRLLVCAWAQGAVERFQAQDMKDAPPLDVVIFGEPFPDITEPGLVGVRTDIDSSVKLYETMRAEHDEHRRKARGTLAFWSVLAFAPLLLCISLGLSLGKAITNWRRRNL